MGYKQLLLLLTVCLVAIRALAQDATERQLGSFDQLIAGDQVIVRLVRSDREYASIRVQGVDARSVRTVVDNRKLTIDVDGIGFEKKKVMVTLNYRELRSIEVINGADVSTASLFTGDSLFVDCKTGGMLYLDADVGFLSSRVIEGSLVTAQGYATSQDIYVSTSATFSGYELESDDIKVKATLGGKAKIYVENSLDAEANSKGYISYKGNPRKQRAEWATGGEVVAYETSQ